MVDVETVLASAVRSGALVRHNVALEQGEFAERRLFLQPEVAALLKSNSLDKRQLAAVHAALRRFVVGGNFTVVLVGSPHREVESIGDLKELKGNPPPFVELRFRPPKHDLRMFGRFVGKDSLVLSTHGMKSLSESTGHKKLSVPEHRARCDAAFQAIGLPMDCVPSTIEMSISKASFS
jgi:hypothetical protein